MSKVFKSADNYNAFSMAKGRLNEVASILNVAIWRQVQRKREKLLQKPLDFSSKWSVTPAETKYGEARYER